MACSWKAGVFAGLSEEKQGIGTRNMNLRSIVSDRGASFGKICAFAVGMLLSGPAASHAQKIFSEDFEGLALGPNVEETRPGAKVWTKATPAGWAIDDSKMPGVGNPAINGITEWAGWSFANKDWWIQAAGNQRRLEFVLGSGAVMIADPDEWDDATHAHGLFDSRISTGPISVAGAAANSLVLFYDSSWRPEAKDDGLPSFPVDDQNVPINDQTGFILAAFDGTTNEIQRWTSTSDASTYHDHAPNESVVIPLLDGYVGERLVVGDR
jgi:hypothetical protein